VSHGPLKIHRYYILINLLSFLISRLQFNNIINGPEVKSDAETSISSTDTSLQPSVTFTNRFVNDSLLQFMLLLNQSLFHFVDIVIF